MMHPLEHLISRLRNRVDSMVARAVIARVNDALKTQRLQITILDGETEDNVEHLQPYGLNFTPPEKAEVLALAVAGDRSHTVAICANAPGSRPKDNSEPETGGLYSKAAWRLFVDKDGVVHIGAQSGAQFVALAKKVDDEIARIWDVLGDSTIVPAAASGPDAGEPGLLALTQLVSTAAGQVKSVAATKAKAT